MTTIQEYNQRLQESRKKAQEQRELAQQSEQKLQEARKKLPEVRSQKALRQTYAGLKGRETRRKVIGTEKVIQGKQTEVEKYKKDIEKFEEGVSKAEQELEIYRKSPGGIVQEAKESGQKPTKFVYRRAFKGAELTAVPVYSTQFGEAVDEKFWSEYQAEALKDQKKLQSITYKELSSLGFTSPRDFEEKVKSGTLTDQQIQGGLDIGVLEKVESIPVQNQPQVTNLSLQSSSGGGIYNVTNQSEIGRTPILSKVKNYFVNQSDELNTASPSPNVVSKAPSEFQYWKEQTAGWRLIGGTVDWLKDASARLVRNIETDLARSNPDYQFYQQTATSNLAQLGTSVATYSNPAGASILLGEGIESFATKGGRANIGKNIYFAEASGQGTTSATVFAIGEPILKIGLGTFGVRSQIKNLRTDQLLKNAETIGQQSVRLDAGSRGIDISTTSKITRPSFVDRYLLNIKPTGSITQQINPYSITGNKLNVQEGAGITYNFGFKGGKPDYSNVGVNIFKNTGGGTIYGSAKYGTGTQPNIVSNLDDTTSFAGNIKSTPIGEGRITTKLKEVFETGEIVRSVEGNIFVGRDVPIVSRFLGVGKEEGNILTSIRADPTKARINLDTGQTSLFGTPRSVTKTSIIRFPRIDSSSSSSGTVQYFKTAPTFIDDLLGVSKTVTKTPISKTFGTVINEIKPTSKPSITSQVINEPKESSTLSKPPKIESQFAGTGLYERTDETFAPLSLGFQNVQINQLQMDSQIQRTKQFLSPQLSLNQEMQQKQELKSIEREMILINQKELLFQNNLLSEKSLLSSKSQLQQKQKQTQKTRQSNQITSSVQKSNKGQSTPSIILPILSTIKSKGSNKKEIQDELFQVFGKRFGRDFSLGVFSTKREAERKLKGFLIGTLGRSGKITKGGKELSFKELDLFKGGQFRPSKKSDKRIVQKRKFSLGTGSEVSEIMLFRKGNNKKKKSKKFDWFN